MNRLDLEDDAPRGAAPQPETRAGPPVLTVTRLIASVRLLMERQMGLVWVGGEISGCNRAASGHLYFTLKDAHAQVRCVLYRTKAQGLPFALRDGLAVELRAVPTMYEARGDFQLNVDSIRLAGLGLLYERFARLKARLEAAGWFAAERKRALPAYPRCVGIVTSRGAAALRDVLTTLRRRWPGVRIVLYPAAVQGTGAAHELAAAIRTANARREVDVLIVCRGGGSIEDLWAFNEEALARAVYDSVLPIVSGVGHETDFTICDFVADVRAPTPTAAAAVVVPDGRGLGQRIAHFAQRLARAQAHTVGTRVQRLDGVARRLVHPAARLARQREQARELALRMARAVRQRVARDAAAATMAQRRLLRELRLPLPGTRAVAHAAQALPRCTRVRVERLAARVAGLAQNLAHLNPRAVLERGYAIVARDDGVIVQDARDVPPGTDVALTFARGAARGTITKTEPD